MDCFNACLLWQKLGSIKWQGLTPCMTYKMAQEVTNAGWQKLGSIKWHGLTPCMTYKMAQGVTNAGWQKPGSIKWQGLNPCIHHKTGPLLWPLHCCGHCRCSLLALCCSKFFLGLALLLRCLWLLLHEPMWNPCWFYMNIYELCNQTSHMDCFNACLLWQKLGSIKWQGLTPCMTYKMAQGVTNAGWQKPDSIKWQGLTPAYTIKQGHCCGHYTAVATAGVPCWHYAAPSFSSGLLCFWDALASFCMSLCETPAGFIWIYMSCATRQATWIASMRACSGKS